MDNAWTREIERLKRANELCEAELKSCEARVDRLLRANDTLYVRWLDTDCKLKSKENELIEWVDAYGLEISNVETMLAVLHHEYNAKGPRWIMNAFQVAHNGTQGGMMDKLESCLFCESPTCYVKEVGKGNFQVVCDGCGYHGAIGDSNHKAGTLHNGLIVDLDRLSEQNRTIKRTARELLETIERITFFTD